MTVKSLLRLLVCPLLLFCSSCSQSSQPQAPASTQPEPTKMAQPAEEVKVHDVTQEDITKIPGITSRNISVAGVKLGDRTRDLDKLLGKPLKTESLPKLYRTAYDNYGIYIDTDRYVGKVISIYINTNYFK